MKKKHFLKYPLLHLQIKMEKFLQKNFEEKFEADFIFLNCPTICPMMSKELKSV